MSDALRLTPKMETRRDPSRFLLLALTPGGWGETAFALHLGNGLREAGHDAIVLTRTSTLPLFSGTDLPYEVIPDQVSARLPLLIDKVMDSVRPDVIVLCDIATTERALRLARSDPRRLLNYRRPIVGVDTWDAARTGATIDLFAGDSMDVATWLNEVPLRLHPVPFLRPDNSRACQFLPHRAELTSGARARVRRELGVSGQKRMVLFCTAEWQHASYDNKDCERLGEQVPLLLGHYLARLGSAVHLVHIGPVSVPLEPILQERYHWLPPQTPDVLEATMAASDLVLSANVSAATVAKAVVSTIPVVVVENSIGAAHRGQVASAIEGDLLPEVAAWLDAALPIYPFALWPLGYKQYLAPILDQNPYTSAIARIELCDGNKALETLRRLLFVPDARDELRQCQADYVSQVRLLPTPAASLLSQLAL